MAKKKGEQTRKLKFSVNTLLIDKVRPNNTIAFSTGFESVEMTVEELAETVQMGFAVSYQFIGGERKTSNFLATDIAEVDVDGGRTMQEALDDPLVKKHCEFLYTTPSHSPDRHRFRLVFSLPRTITSHKDIRAIAISLTRRLGGDMAATDAARLFYGSSQGHITFIGRQITEELLKELIIDGSVIPVQDSVASNGRVATARSALQIDPSFKFKTAAGYDIEMQKVANKVSAFCPFHFDKRPSAFLSLSKSGNTYFHCSVCQLTRWMKNSNLTTYDFDSFVRTLKLPRKHKINKNQDNSIDLFIEANQDIKSSVVHFSSDQFLQIKEIPLGITFVKSPKGSGKTSYLAESLGKVLFTFGENTLEAIEKGDDPVSPSPVYTKTRALLIGHRQALIRDLSNRLGLNCYLDDPSSKSDTKSRKARYGVCLDSLWRVREEAYDILIIDEVEQVLSHFLSDTLGEDRYKVFEYFKSLVRSTPRVVVLDADLGWNSFTTLTQIKKSKTKISSKQIGEENINIYINEWIGPQRTLNVYSSQHQLIGNLIAAAYDGKRVFVTSNSKEKIKQIRKALDEKAVASRVDSLRIFQITSENSREKETQEFINNIKSRILQYDVVLSSPSLGTGVDITFNGAESKIDIVYGFFENQINSHMEIDQQLARVRHPGDVRTWVSPRKYNFEFDFDIVKEDFIKHNLFTHLFPSSEIGFIEGNNEEQSLFVNMASMILSDQRASKNSLKQNFIVYKRTNGWLLNEVPPDDFEVVEGKELYLLGKIKLKEEEIERIVSASPMPRLEFDDMKERLDLNDQEISRTELESYWRTKIELFYQIIITKQLIEHDNKGRYRDAVSRYTAITNISAIREQNKNRLSGIKSLKMATDKTKVMKERGLGDILLVEILDATPIYKNCVFLPSIEFNLNDLDEFICIAKKMRVFSETQLGLPIRVDIEIKATEQLGDFLKVVGLKLKMTRTKKVNGKKIYFYKLDPIAYSEIESIANIRRGVNDVRSSDFEWRLVNKLHGFDESDSTFIPKPLMIGRRKGDNGLIFNDFI